MQITQIPLLCCPLNDKFLYHYSSLQFFRNSIRYTLASIGKVNKIGNQLKSFQGSTDVVMPTH